MEKYVSEILNMSDLSVITKKHVRQKYKEYVGRELSADERDKINSLVLNFVKNLAAKQTGYSESDASDSGKVEEVSPGNKENIVAEKTNRRFILKGQMMDTGSLHKAKPPGIKAQSSAPNSSEQSASSDSGHDKHVGSDESRQKFQRVERTKIKDHKPSTMKVSNVIHSHLDSGDESSSSVSSLTGSDLEVDETLEQQKALEQLREARERKIKMSIERKNDTKQHEPLGIAATKHYSRLLDEENSSDALSLISDQSSPHRLQKQTGLAVLEKCEHEQSEKRRRSVEEVFGPDTSSLPLKKTPVKYEKHSCAIRSASSEKVVKRKKLLIPSDSDSDTDFSSLKKKQHLKKISKSLDNIKRTVNKIDSDSDSEDEPLSAIAARTQALKAKSEPRKKKSHSESGKPVKNLLSMSKTATVVLHNLCDSLPSLSDSEISSLSLCQNDEPDKDVRDRNCSGHKNVHNQHIVKREDKLRGHSSLYKSKSGLAQTSKHKSRTSSLSGRNKASGAKMSMKQRVSESVTMETESSGPDNTLVNSPEYDISQESDQEKKPGKRFLKLKEKSAKGHRSCNGTKQKSKSYVFEIGSTSTDSDIGEGFGVKCRKLQQMRPSDSKARVSSVTDRPNMTLKCENLNDDEVVIISEDTCEDDPPELGCRDTRVKHDAVREATLAMEDSPIKSVKKRSGKKSIVISSTESNQSDPDNGHNSDFDLDDSDLDIPLADLKQKNTSTEDAWETSVKQAAVEDSRSLRLLKRICRECRLFVRDDRELKDCTTDEEKIRKCEQMLREIGMEGIPTLEKAVKVRKLKEAAELSADSVISSETGRVMRKVKSIYARRQISPLKPVKRSSNLVTAQSEWVDSDGTSDNL